MKIAVMIMAAGESRRFGECKLLTAVSQTENLLSRSIQQTSQSEVGPVFVITGRWHQEIKLAQQQGQVPIVPLIYCPQWSQGLGASIAYGVRQLAQDFDAVLITLADQVALQSEDFQRLVEAASSQHIVCAYYNQRRGVPALFPASCFSQLTMLNGEHGARSLLRGDTTLVREISLPNAALDIDTPEMLMRWRYEFAK
ncbi:TPA: NTP transferase domain-containing protein [Vibrio fluvialis]